MDNIFMPFFKKYEELIVAADGAFTHVKNEYPQHVKCEIKCSDCCYALFDLAFIEALYINYFFNKKFDGAERGKLIEKANKADRQIYKIKNKAYKEFEAGKSEDEILLEMASERIRCPLLNDENLCSLYEYRPITCRFYGIPTSIGGKGHTCGKSGFVEGKQYPTVNLDIIHKRLYELSDKLVKKIKSKHIKMAELLVPLSMSLLTVYDEEYLGIGEKEKSDNSKEDENG